MTMMLLMRTTTTTTTTARLEVLTVMWLKIQILQLKALLTFVTLGATYPLPQRNF
jgi:hypothetical protein